MYGIGAKFNGVVLGLLTYYFFHNPYVAIAVAFGYVLGESFGWGEWIGTLTSGEKYYIFYNHTTEGQNNGIKWMASIFFDTYEDWTNYCRLALTIRGFYWWLPTLAPLYFVGISMNTLLLAILLLSIGFPIACEIGYHTTTKFNFKHMGSGWEHQEVWYGLMQDIILGGLIICGWVY